MVEIAKAIKLKPYEYFKRAFNEILVRQDDSIESHINDLHPWSDMLPDACKEH